MPHVKHQMLQVDLSNTMDSQRDALRAAQRQYAAYVLSGEESSQAAQELANSIRELSSDLNRNESRMREAQEAAQRLTREMDDADGSFDRASPDSTTWVIQLTTPRAVLLL